ncbi:MAG: hypothetical protein IKS90_01065 [Clostridia bacterium]|nr:hypothetical protein [Clostridia bacterium]
MKRVDKNSWATLPGNAEFSFKKYRYIRRSALKGIALKLHADLRIKYVSDILRSGDTNPALVMSTAPLIVSCYSFDMDAVIMLEFPSALAEEYTLKTGDRLVTANVYSLGKAVLFDIFPGIEYSNMYIDFTPVVQLFLSKNDEEIRARTSLFDEACWQKVERLSNAYITEHPTMRRKGFFCFIPYPDYW